MTRHSIGAMISECINSRYTRARSTLCIRMRGGQVTPVRFYTQPPRLHRLIDPLDGQQVRRQAIVNMILTGQGVR